MPRIFLTQPILPRAQALLAQLGEIVVAPAVDVESLRRAADGCDVVVVRAQLPDDIFDAAPSLVGAVRHGAGVDMIPIEAATAHGVLVANAPGANAGSVAEHVVGQMVRLARNASPMAARLRLHDQQAWAEARAMADAGVELAGRTVGLVGYGHIGQAIARICIAGFGMKVLAHTRLGSLGANIVVEAVSLASLMERSDFVVLACPLTPRTRGLIGREQLARMCRGAFLINVSRGPVVDEPALIDALRSGLLAGAALDVFDRQPLPVEHPFWSLDRVLITPHVAGVSDDSMWRMGRIVVSAVAALVAGHVPEHCINPEAASAFRRRSTRRALHS